MTKRSYGDGGIDQRGKNSFRLRYRIGKQRYADDIPRHSCGGQTGAAAIASFR